MTEPGRSRRPSLSKTVRAGLVEVVAARANLGLRTSEARAAVDWIQRMLEWHGPVREAGRAHRERAKRGELAPERAA